jgi:hypothetical protein
MSLAAIRTRVLWLGLCAGLIGSTAGCTEFQTMHTNKWIDGNWLQSNSNAAPVNDMFAYWDARVRLTEDSSNGGVQRHGLAGRLFLFNDGQCVEANGKVIVKMVDLTHPEPGKEPELLGEWGFPATALKQLRRRDGLGEGYTLFLPWPNFHPAIKHVQVQVCYVPEKGSPRYSSPSALHLQTTDSQPMIRERQIVAGERSRPALPPIPTPLP